MFDTLQLRIIDLIRTYRVDRNNARISLVVFDRVARVVFSLDEYDNIADVIEAVRVVQIGDEGTNLAAALRIVRSQVFLGTFDRPRIVYVFMGSRSTTQRNEAITEAAAGLRDDRIGVITVGILGLPILTQQLQSAAWSPRYVKLYASAGSIDIRDVKRSGSTLSVGECRESASQCPRNLSNSTHLEPG